MLLVLQNSDGYLLPVLQMASKHGLTWWWVGEYFPGKDQGTVGVGKKDQGIRKLSSPDV